MGTRTATHVTAPDPNDPTTMISTGVVQIVDTRTTADAQSDALSRLAHQCQAIYAAGRNYLGKNFQIDDVSLQNINGAASLALVAAQAGTWPSGFEWIASDNTTMALAQPSDMIAFAVNAAEYVTALILINRSLKDAISTLQTVGDCDAFDVTMGWPAN